MRRLIAWLNKRFPVQLVVTREEYERLELGINNISNSVLELNRRLGAVELQIRRLNESQGYQPLAKGSVRLER